METITELRERLERDRPVKWDALPDLPLYMDQIISYMPRQLIHFEEEDSLTSAMVNNYIKAGLLPRAEGKRYGREHLAYLTAICALKQVLSVREMSLLLGEAHNKEIPELYEYYTAHMDAALTRTAGELGDAETTRRGDLARLALVLALRSYANKLACQRILTALDCSGPQEK